VKVINQAYQKYVDQLKVPLLVGKLAKKVEPGAGLLKMVDCDSKQNYL